MPLGRGWRALDVRDSRLFAVNWEGPLWRAWVVRGAALFAACAVAWLLATLGLLFAGDTVPTLRAHVQPGPAANAGMQEGDRIVAVDGHAVSAASHNPASTRRYTVERTNRKHFA